MIRTLRYRHENWEEPKKEEEEEKLGGPREEKQEVVSIPLEKGEEGEKEGEQ